MWLLSILWLVVATIQTNDMYLLISQLWLIALWFIKDDQ